MTTGSLHLKLSWSLPRASLSFTDFNLYPFTVINHNREYNSFQWVLWILTVNNQSEGGLGDPCYLLLVSGVTAFWGTAPPQTLYNHPPRNEISLYAWEYFFIFRQMWHFGCTLLLMWNFGCTLLLMWQSLWVFSNIPGFSFQACGRIAFSHPLKGRCGHFD